MTSRPAIASAIVHLGIISLFSAVSGQKVRLVNGGSSNQGRLEVKVGGVWGTVCDDGFGVEEARVVCRELGYNDLAQAVAHSYAHFGYGTGDIHLGNVACDGSEKSILDCPTGSVDYCYHYEDAGVSCGSGGGDGCLTSPPCAIPEEFCIYRETEILRVPHQVCPICRCASCPSTPTCPRNCKSGKTEYYNGVRCRRCRCVPQDLPEVIEEPNTISLALLIAICTVMLVVPIICLIVVCICKRTQQQKGSKSRPKEGALAAPKQDNWLRSVAGGHKPKMVAVY